jgi:hypothetical protein
VVSWSAQANPGAGNQPFDLAYRWCWGPYPSILIDTPLGPESALDAELDPDLGHTRREIWTPMSDQPAAAIQPDQPIALEVTVFFEEATDGPIQVSALTPDNASEALAGSEMAVILWIKFTDTEPEDSPNP